MEGNKQRVIIALLVLNAVLIFSFGSSLTKKLDTQIQNVSSQVSNINSYVSSLSDNIANRIQGILDSSNDLLDRTEYKYLNIDPSKNEASLDIEVKLKAVKPDSRIYIVYEDSRTGNQNEIELTKKGGLLYGANIELPLNQNYQYDIFERSDSGGEALLNIHKQYINLYEEFYRGRIQSQGTKYSRSENDYEFEISFTINEFGMDGFGLKSALLEIRHQDKLIDTLDVTDKIIQEQSKYLSDHYNKAIASGEIDPHTSYQEFKKQYEYMGDGKDTRTYYRFSHRVVYDSDYPELKPKGNNTFMNVDMGFTLILTFEDGYQARIN